MVERQTQSPATSSYEDHLSEKAKQADVTSRQAFEKEMASMNELLEDAYEGERRARRESERLRQEK